MNVNEKNLSKFISDMDAVAKGKLMVTMQYIARGLRDIFSPDPTPPQPTQDETAVDIMNQRVGSVPCGDLIKAAGLTCIYFHSPAHLTVVHERKTMTFRANDFDAAVAFFVKQLEKIELWRDAMRSANVTGMSGRGWSEVSAVDEPQKSEGERIVEEWCIKWGLSEAPWRGDKTDMIRRIDAALAAKVDNIRKWLNESASQNGNTAEAYAYKFAADHLDEVK